MSPLEVTRQYHFSAGHRLESQAFSPEDNARLYGQCYRQHGHNYLVEVGENLAMAFWAWIEPALPPGALRRVTVVETDNNTFEYRG